MLEDIERDSLHFKIAGRYMGFAVATGLSKTCRLFRLFLAYLSARRDYQAADTGLSLSAIHLLLRGRWPCATEVRRVGTMGDILASRRQQTCYQRDGRCCYF